MGKKATVAQRAAYADREHALYRMFSQGDRDPQEVLDLFQSAIDGSAWSHSTVATTQSPLASTLVATLTVSVDPRKPVEEMVAAAAFNGYVNPNVTTANFPHQEAEPYQAVIEIRQSSRNWTTAEGERELAACGLALPTMDDQLAVAEQHPDECLNRLIVFLGSVWVSPRGACLVGYLSADSQVRYLNLNWGDPDSQWSQGNLLAGVRK